MKICSRCKGEFTKINFSNDKSRKDGLSNRCKNCQRKLSRKHYIDNKLTYKDRQETRRLKNAEYVNEVKETVGCSFCNEKRGICLDFHHKNKEEKSFSIASHLNYSIPILQEEMKKCIVVCANCHRVIHSKDVFTEGEICSWEQAS